MPPGSQLPVSLPSKLEPLLLCWPHPHWQSILHGASSMILLKHKLDSVRPLLKTLWWLLSEKKPKSLSDLKAYMICPHHPLLSITASPCLPPTCPRSLYSSHTGLLTIPGICQWCSHLWPFAHAVLSACYNLPLEGNTCSFFCLPPLLKTLNKTTLCSQFNSATSATPSLRNPHPCNILYPTQLFLLSIVTGWLPSNIIELLFRYCVCPCCQNINPKKVRIIIYSDHKYTPSI